MSSMKILAVEDCGFKRTIKQKQKEALLVGVIITGFRIDQVLFSRIEVDGLDATKKLIDLIISNGEEVELIMLSSISYGGFNLIDPLKLYNVLGVPVIVVNPKKPNSLAVESALFHHFNDWKKRLQIINRVGEPEELDLKKGNKIYYHIFGIEKVQGEKLIRSEICFGKIPEPLRIAKIIAHGIK